MYDYLNSLPHPRTFLLVFGTYVLAAVVFYYYPEIIPRRKPSKNKMYNFLVISHRGGSGENSENTMAAFKHSFELGVDMFELDCHITKDGKVVVAHDNNLNRLCGVDKLISETNYDDLPPLLAKHVEDIFLEINKEQEIFNNNGLHNRVNSHNSKAAAAAAISASEYNESRRIPLLEDIFEQFPNMPINIDIKFNSEELISKVHDLIVKYKREKITVWGSFKENICKKCYKANNQIPIYFSLLGVVKLLILMLTGLLPFMPLKESHLEVIMPNNLLKYKRNTLPKAAIAPLMLIKMFFVRKSLVKHLQKRGIFVIYWTLNTEDEFETAFEVGANGIITDYPSRLIKYIEKKPELKKALIRPTSYNF